jgi:hypothetical protein
MQGASIGSRNLRDATWGAQGASSPCGAAAWGLLQCGDTETRHQLTAMWVPAPSLSLGG